MITAKDVYGVAFEGKVPDKYGIPAKFASGQRWRNGINGKEYILATTFRNTVKLINLRTGNRARSAGDACVGGKICAAQARALFEFDNARLRDWSLIQY